MIAWPRRVLALMALAVATIAAPPAGAGDKDDCVGARTVELYNGRIHTMDAANRVLSAVTIRNGRFVVGDGDDRGSGPCAVRIDLGHRIVVPGLIDNHNHFLLLGLRPGFHTPLESAASFADIAAIYHARIAHAPGGAFITTIGGFNPVQFAEKRLPNLQELDAIAPNNPVYIQFSFTGPATTNTQGKAFFASKGVVVGNDGSIAANAPTVAALNALRSVQTFADKLRGTMDAMNYAASLGVTTHYDMGGFIVPGSPDHDNEFEADGAASWDPYTAYDAILDLHRRGMMKVRVRVFYLSMDQDPTIPILSRRVENAFRQFGDDWLRASGLGEFISSWPLFGLPFPTNYPAAVQAAASRGWIYQQHTLSTAEDSFSLSAWETVNQQIPIAPLHWSLAHVISLTPANIARLKALGAGAAVHAWLYLFGVPGFAGPPYRTILDSGIQVGAGSDSAQISTLNPWNMLYYMSTGINAAGQLINAGQTLTRDESIRLYTAANGWFVKEESKLGSIETGKLGDLVVLSDDYFTVPDAALRRIHSVLTIVGGRIVYDAGVVHIRERD